jgi:hypothetical protein
MHPPILAPHRLGTHLLQLPLKSLQVADVQLDFRLFRHRPFLLAELDFHMVARSTFSPAQLPLV